MPGKKVMYKKHKTAKGMPKKKGNAKQAAKALKVPVNSGSKKIDKFANRTAKKVTRAAKKVAKKAGMPKYNKKKK